MSVIDGTLEGLIWAAAGLPPKVGCLFTRRMDLSYKIERLDELLELKQPGASIMEKWHKAKSMLGDPRRHRNSFAHAMPVRVGASPILMTTRDAPVGDIFKAVPMAITETTKAMGKASEVLTLLKRIVHELQTTTSSGKS